MGIKKVGSQGPQPEGPSAYRLPKQVLKQIGRVAEAGIRMLNSGTQGALGDVKKNYRGKPITTDHNVTLGSRDNLTKKLSPFSQQSQSHGQRGKRH
jgi:hypothetical protein